MSAFADLEAVLFLGHFPVLLFRADSGLPAHFWVSAFFRFCLSVDFRTPLDFLGFPRGAFLGTTVCLHLY